MTNQADGEVEETKKAEHVSDDYRLLLLIGFMLLLMGWLFAVFYIGWLFVPFGFYYLYKAYRARKGADILSCSACGCELGKTKVPKCPGCGVDLE